MPALDIVVEELDLRGRKLGRLEIEAVKRNSGTSQGHSGWGLSKLPLGVSEARCIDTGSGAWRL